MLFDITRSGVERRHRHKETVISAALIILLIALLLGGVGLFVEALRWVLIIALVLLVISAFTGWRSRRVV